MKLIRGSLVVMSVTVVLFGLAPAASRGQGILVDRRPRVPISQSFEIREVSIDAQVRDQVADVRISQTFHNPGSFPLEAEFLFPLPEDGGVQNFVLMVDGRELAGRLIAKDEARRIYEEIVRTKRDPALLEYMGRGLYRTSVFPIPPGADRTVTMRYSQLCRRDRDVVEFAYPLGTQKFTAKPIQKLAIKVTIASKEAIKSVYCPGDDPRIDRAGDHDMSLNLERREVVPRHDFRLIYTLAKGQVAASILSYRPSASEDGYFLVLASPEVKSADTKPQPKTVVFVIDRSGSMAGKKIEQARNTLKTVLNNLRDGDLFNIVVYDDRVESFKPELQRYGSNTRDEAVRFVENIRAGGSTNIDEALRAAVSSIHDTSSPSYVIFLTDGLPTAGETRELAIAEHCHQANAHRARLFCFGVGYDVNARLLDRLSSGNSGTSEYVKPDEDIEARVGRFYARMTSPVLTDIQLQLVGIDINRTYPRDVPDLFEGGQIVWAGRYRQSGHTTIRISGKVGAERQTLEFAAELTDRPGGGAYGFVERLWVVRRIGELIDEIDLHGQNKELVDELVSLSTKYGILTPYTSFLADETTQLHARAENLLRTRENLVELSVIEGQAGVSQRDHKQAMINAQRAFVGDSFDTAPAAAAPSSPMHAGATTQRGTALAGREAHLSRQGQQVKRNTGGRVIQGNPGFGIPATAASPAAGKPVQTRENKIRHIGTKTFYWKNDRWIDSEVRPDEEAGATVVPQMSEAYFELARKQSPASNEYFSQAEPVTVKLDGKVYRVDPASPEPAH